LLAERRSLLAFASTPIESETLASLMEAARWAPFFNERTAVEFSRGHEGKQTRF
jgi:nitroreductase